jgi:hypothetical protein
LSSKIREESEDQKGSKPGASKIEADESFSDEEDEELASKFKNKNAKSSKGGKKKKSSANTKTNKLASKPINKRQTKFKKSIWEDLHTVVKCTYPGYEIEDIDSNKDQVSYL